MAGSHEVASRFPQRLAARHVGVAAAFGVVATLAAAAFLAWQVAVLIGWSLWALVYLVRLWPELLGYDSRTTATHATREDDSRLAADVTLLAASVSSLVAVALMLVKAAQKSGATQALYTAIAVLGVLLAWAVVHTLFTLRYAHLYYVGSKRGIDFGEEGEPTYRDFAYVAFTIGMTYQVSDTDLTSKPIRATALRHALLSWVFGTAIIAVTVNVVAGLVK